jgi:putative oxygen-independent coproporphyrinogen III oxidase
VSAGAADVPHCALPPLSLYVHIPWCVKKCPYCDFNSHNAPQRIPHDAYIAALLADLDQELAFAGGRRIETIFFGGGTPSLFAPTSIARILDGVAARLTVAADAEITLETNPGTVEHGSFIGYREAGVNRISFGVQSFDDGALERIGRIHDAQEARAAVRQAQDSGLDNINIDLMYALPGQDLAAALYDIEQAIALSPTHLSHYQLTLEPNTLFAAKPPPAIPDDDHAWDMQEQCQAALAGAGFAQYEVSAYAREDRRCAHNLNYWSFGDYFGIGAGAHGKLTARDGDIRRPWKLKQPRAYLDTAHGAARLGGNESVAVAQLPFEFMLNALRLNDGFELRVFEAHTGLAPAAIAAPLAQASERGWLMRRGDRILATPLGLRFLNNVIELFMP